MAKNELTPTQDITTREFLMEVALAENVLNNDPSYKKQLIRILYDMLGYQRLIDGRFIDKSKKITYLLGGIISREKYPCEWDKDYKRALKLAAQQEREGTDEEPKRQEEMFATHYNDTDEADSSEPTKNPSLWKTLLSKDV